MPTVFLNGTFVEGDGARVSAFDAAIQHGVGLFETMLGGIAGEDEVRRREGQGEAITGIGAFAMGLERHLERLIESAKELGLSDRLRAGPLAEAVLRTIEKSGLARTRVRLTITGGDLNLLRRDEGTKGQRREGEAKTKDEEAGVQPTLMIVAQEATYYPPEIFERGAGVVIADLRVNPLDPTSGHKTVNYWQRLRELQRAAAARAGEALVFQVSNHLAGGCVSNAFLVKDGALVTPIARGEEGTEASRHQGIEGERKGVALPSPVLPGVTRRWVLDWAQRTGTPVRTKMIAIDEVLGADEVLLTNSSWGVMPVVKVEREAIGDGVVGEVGAELIAAWRVAVGDA